MKRATQMRPFASASALTDRARHLENKLSTLENVKLAHGKARAALVKLQGTLEQTREAGTALSEVQSRLESTINNLQIQAQNLQAADSLLGDMDTAVNMSDFVKHQIITQTAVAMLAQTTTTPRMAMELL